LIIRDSSKFDCTVRARVVVAGYTQAGRVIALVRAVGDLAVDMPLRPSSPNVAGEELPPGRYLVIDLWGVSEMTSANRTGCADNRMK
jgi:hypothetical protein